MMVVDAPQMTRALPDTVQLCCLLLPLFLQVSGSISRIDCSSKDFLNNCFKQSGVLQQNHTGIPLSEKELDDMCSIYKLGMSCLTSYMDHCITDAKGRSQFEQRIAWAQLTTTLLCNDNPTRIEYLKHPECHREMSPAWNNCSEPLKLLLERSGKKKPGGGAVVEELEICRTREEFLACVSNASQAKCSPKASQFYQKLVSGFASRSGLCTVSNASTAAAPGKLSHQSSLGLRNLPPYPLLPTGILLLLLVVVDFLNY